MLPPGEQEFVRQSLDRARRAAISEDASEVRSALEELERAARLITDAMFRPTGLASGPDAGSEEEATPLTEVS